MATIQRTTRLDAVNRMLSTIAQAPVASLSGSLPPDATRAIAVLDEVDLETQARGWHFNVERKLLTATTGKIAVDATWARVSVSRGEYPTIDITWRDDSGTLRLYDRQNNTFTVGDLWATVVTMGDYEKTPEAFRRYVAIRACRLFADRYQGDQAKHAYTERDEADAFRFLKEAEGFTEQRTIFDSYQAARPLLRQYPNTNPTNAY